MGAKTNRFGLSTLGPGDSMADEGFKFSDQDIVLIDRLLQLATEGHHHNGVPAMSDAPPSAPGLILTTTGGGMASGRRFYYKFTLVDGVGNETTASPVAFLDSPSPVSDPAAPALAYIATGGALDPGNYSYVVSAYVGATTLESKAVNSAFVTVAIPASTGKVQLTLPPLPPGATGFNIYRKAPNGARYQFIESTTSTTTWLDDGSLDPDCNRSLPSTNTTNNQGRITVSYPGATPVVPFGFTWKIYRTSNPNDWANSLLKHVVEATGATPVVNTSFEDVGGATISGKPPGISQLIGNPGKIDLTDAAEVTGVLPPGAIVYPKTVSFTIPGAVTVGVSPFTWISEFDKAEILGVRAYLGADSWPASNDVIVDVTRYNTGTLTWDSLFSSSPKPTVPVSSQIGDRVVPDVVSLVAGDTLAVEVLQTGGGATPTDQNLTVALLLMVQTGSTTVTTVLT